MGRYWLWCWSAVWDQSTGAELQSLKWVCADAPARWDVLFQVLSQMFHNSNKFIFTCPETVVALSLGCCSCGLENMEVFSTLKCGISLYPPENTHWRTGIGPWSLTHCHRQYKPILPKQILFTYTITWKEYYECFFCPRSSASVQIQSLWICIGSSYVWVLFVVWCAVPSLTVSVQ